MADYELLFPGRFLRAVDLMGKHVTAEIAQIRSENLPLDDGGEKSKAVIAFKGKDRQWVVNKTNAICLAGMFGRDTDGWLGKRVTLYPTTVRGADGKQTLAIRVYGSPDLKEPIDVTVKLPKRKPYTATMHVTGRTPPSPAPGGA